MRSVARSRRVAADRDAVWALVSDPFHLPRWWPQLQRVEDASPEAWTKVLLSTRGKSVRVDYSRAAVEPPRRIVWRQEVEESPFEAILAYSTTEITLEPDGERQTRVELRSSQKLRGSYRLGGLMMRRAVSRQLDEALDGLERAVAGR